MQFTTPCKFTPLEFVNLHYRSVVNLQSNYYKKNLNLINLIIVSSFTIIQQLIIQGRLEERIHTPMPT